MKRASLFLLGTTFILATSTTTFAQSLIDLEPPLQADTNSRQIENSPDPMALPTFKFAMAKINESGDVEVTTKFATQELVAVIDNGHSGSDSSRGIPYTEEVTQTYTVRVPYTEIEDGVTVANVTKSRLEQRTRTVAVMRGTTKTVAKNKTTTYKMANVKCLAVDGTELTPEAAKERLAENYPVILINSPQAITRYFEAVMQPEALFLVCQDK